MVGRGRRAGGARIALALLILGLLVGIGGPAPPIGSHPGPPALPAEFRPLARSVPPSQPVARSPLCASPDDLAVPCDSGNVTTASEWLGAPVLPPTIAPAHLAVDAGDAMVLLATEAPGQPAPTNPADLGPAAFYGDNGSGWWQLPLSDGPPYAAGASLIDDPALDRVVYVVPVLGGGGSAVTETWTYLGGAWTELSESAAPSARVDASVAYDPSVGGVVLFGGFNATTFAPLDDTWVLGASGWAEVPTGATAPSARGSAALGWSGALSALVLLGGCSDLPWAGCANDTWSFSGSAWSNLSIAGPPEVGSYSAGPFLEVPDASGSGLDAVPVWLGSAPNASAGWWRFGGTAWSYVFAAAAGPFAGNATAAVWAGSPTDYLEFPAQRGGPGDLTTWSGGDPTWGSELGAAPTPRSGAAITYDPADGYVLLFGGASAASGGGLLSDSWSYDHGRWSILHTNATPPARANAGLVYDARDGYVLLFGGDRNDTWEFTDGGWTQITPARSPPVEAQASMVYDGADGVVLWVGGYPTSYTWTYTAGNWTNRSGSGGPSGPPANPLVYDAADGYVLEQGTLTPGAGGSGPVPTDATWSYLDGTWTNRTAGAGAIPSARSGAATAVDPLGGSVLLFGGLGPGTGAPLNDTWAWSGGAWDRVPGPSAPSGRTGMAAVSDPSDGVALFFGGAWTGPSGTLPGAGPGGGCPAGGTVCNDTWWWTPDAQERPYIAAFVARPSPVDSGADLDLNVSVVGGEGPLAFNFTGLPPGCAPVNLSEITCAPSLPGAYRPVVVVRDVRGDPAAAVVGINVTAPLEVAVANFTPSSVPIGGRSLLSVRTSGGSGQDTYAYLGLPPGCSSQSVPTLPCTPTASGTYPVSIFASDSGGGLGEATVTLDATPVGVPGGPLITSFDVIPDGLVLGNVTEIAINASDGGRPLTYHVGGLPPGCAPANASVLDCQPGATGTFELNLSVADPEGGTADVLTNLTVYPAGGGGGALITRFAADAPSLPLGNATTIAVSATSGAGPLSYAYPDLPPGCVSANTSALPCTPNATGTFRLFVVVTDTDGHRTGAFSTLAVTPSLGIGPAIALFSAAPRTVPLGQSVELFLAVTGGTAPLAYAYTNLPGPCNSTDAPDLNCTPSMAGHFNITVTVTDARGRSAEAALALEVVAPVGPSTSPGPSLGDQLRPLETVGGIATVAFVIVALGLWVGTEAAIRRSRVRVEGQDLVAALRRPGPDPPPEGPRP